jgi:hypothetical protein
MPVNPRYPALMIVLLIASLIDFSCHHNPVSPEPLSPSPMIDYFPLKVGNYWSYSFSNYSDSASQMVQWYIGTDAWEIISAATTNQDTIYTIQETITGYHVSKYFGTPPETTFVANANLTSTITDSPGKHLDLNFAGDSPFQWLTVYQKTSAYFWIMRYRPASSLPDSLYSYTYYNARGTDTIITARSIGITRCYNSGSSNGRFEDQISLTGYRLR